MYGKAKLLKRIVILGSTGSIGRQTLDVIRRFPDDFDVVALCAGNNIPLLQQQIDEFNPLYIHCLDKSVTERTLGSNLNAAYLDPVDIVTLPDLDLVVVATVGDAGLSPTLAALNAGTSVALANKEVLVMAGSLVTKVASGSGAQILPVDSEPSAIWQCLAGEAESVGRLIITASGGAFRDRDWNTLSDVSPEEALCHPTWSMGRKITVDSATLVNKAFEVIEAHWLFGVPYERIDTVLHRQSIVHSFVEFIDGSVKAQVGPPDMRYPIQYALFYPERRQNKSLPRFNPVTAGDLTFEYMDPDRYPCFRLALEAGKKGGTWPAVVTSADAAAVDLFLNGRIRFTDIPDRIESVLAEHEPTKDPSLEEIQCAAKWATGLTLNGFNHLSS